MKNEALNGFKSVVSRGITPKPSTSLLELPSSPGFRRTSLRTSCATANNGGFALLEVAIVLLLFAVLAGISAVNLRFFDRMIVRSEIEKLHTICRYLQQSAMVSNESCTLTFDREHKKYVYNNAVQQLPAQVDFGVLAGAQGPPSAPTHPINSPITFSDERITFYPSGIVGSGTVYLVDANHDYMCALSCGVSHVSYLRKYEYDGAWRLLS